MNPRLDMADVSDPLPWSLVLGLAVATTLAIYMVLDWGLSVAVELFAAQVSSASMAAAGTSATVLSALSGVVGLGLYLRSDVVGLVAERTDRAVVVSTRTRIASSTVEVPLGELRSLRVEAGQLVVEGATTHRLGLPSRSRAAVEALEAFIDSCMVQGRSAAP